MCQQSGFRFGGVLDKTHCHCGDELSPSLQAMNWEPASHPIDACSLPCPLPDFYNTSQGLHVPDSTSESVYNCSDMVTLNVYRTGLAREFQPVGIG